MRKYAFVRDLCYPDFYIDLFQVKKIPHCPHCNCIYSCHCNLFHPFFIFFALIKLVAGWLHHQISNANTKTHFHYFTYYFHRHRSIQTITKRTLHRFIAFGFLIYFFFLNHIFMFFASHQLITFESTKALSLIPLRHRTMKHTTTTTITRKNEKS